LLWNGKETRNLEDQIIVHNLQSSKGNEKTTAKPKAQVRKDTNLLVGELAAVEPLNTSEPNSCDSVTFAYLHQQEYIRPKGDKGERDLCDKNRLRL